MTDTQHPPGTGTLTLVQPTVTLREAFSNMAEDYRINGGGQVDGVFELYSNDFPGYVRQLVGNAYIRDSRGVRVPATTYWLYRPDDRVLLGVSRLRHHLTPALKREGGHIGYSIRPTERRKGHGTRILELTLEKAREFGIFEVLVTCDTANIGSARIIQANGGVFENEVISERTGNPVSRYWITLH